MNPSEDSRGAAPMAWLGRLASCQPNDEQRLASHARLALTHPIAGQVGEHCVHSRSPGTGRAANRVPYPHCTADAPALKPLLSHEDILVRADQSLDTL
jgi:hypothetical protein